MTDNNTADKYKPINPRVRHEVSREGLFMLQEFDGWFFVEHTIRPCGRVPEDTQ